MTYALIDCLLPSPLGASYLVVNAQSKVFPLPSQSQTPAAQPRLLSLVHASGRTPLKLRHKNSPIVQYATSPQYVNSVYSSLSSCRECRYAGFYHSSVHVGAGCTWASNACSINTGAIHVCLGSAGGCGTNLYAPFLSMTSSLSLSLSLSLPLSLVRQRWSEHFESGAAGERPDLKNSRSQWDAERVRASFFFFFFNTAPSARVLTVSFNLL